MPNEIFSTSEMELLQDTAEHHMMDEGWRMIAVSALDDLGDEVLTYTYGAETICGIEMQAGFERHGSDMTIVRWDAILRVPFDYFMEAQDRFLITSFRGRADFILFEVAAPIQRGISANRILLNRLEL